MARDQFRLDADASKFAPQRQTSRRLPNRVVDIDDRFEQSDPAKVLLDGCKQSADPAAVTESHQPKLAAAPAAQDPKELPHFRHALPQSFRRAHPVSYTHLRAHETPEHLVCR